MLGPHKCQSIDLFHQSPELKSTSIQSLWRLCLFVARCSLWLDHTTQPTAAHYERPLKSSLFDLEPKAKSLFHRWFLKWFSIYLL